MPHAQSDRRKWRCPTCGKTYLIRVDADDPIVCRACREKSAPDQSNRDKTESITGKSEPALQTSRSPKQAEQPTVAASHRSTENSPTTVDAFQSRRYRNTWKFVLPALVVVFIAAVFIQVARQERQTTLPATDVYKEAIPSVVVIKGMRNENGPVQGQGSGFIVEPGDIIVTNEHVIRGAASLLVETHDGRLARVSDVLAVDSQRDIAILPVPESIRGTPGLKMTTALPNVGEPVFAIGAPLGLDSTFTQGVVSQIRQQFLEYGCVVQTDASVGPGSSGGPLVNGRVEVVGVNTMAATAESKAQNVNFAVASNEVASLHRHPHPMKLTDLPGYQQPTFEELLPALAAFNQAVQEAAQREQLEQIVEIPSRNLLKLSCDKHWMDAYSGKARFSLYNGNKDFEITEFVVSLSVHDITGEEVISGREYKVTKILGGSVQPLTSKDCFFDTGFARKDGQRIDWHIISARGRRIQ